MRSTAITLGAVVLVAACSGGGDADPSSALGFEIDPAKGRFDPAGVVVYAAVGSSRSFKVVVVPDALDSPVAGLHAGALDFVIRPSDGRLVYQASGDLRVFETDPMPRREDGSWDYWIGSHRNDLYLEDSGCAPRAYSVGSIWSDPDGNVAYRCGGAKKDDPELFVLDGETIVLRRRSEVLALGTQRRALTWGRDVGERPRLMVEDPDSARQVHLERGTWPYTARSDEAGFLAVVGSWNLVDRRTRLGDLVRIRYDGSVELRALYGGWPANVKLEREFALAADGTLYAVATRLKFGKPAGKRARYGTLLRFRTDGSEAEIVLSDDDARAYWDLRVVAGSGGSGQPPAEAAAE